MTHRIVLVTTAFLAIFCLFAATAMAQDHCREIKVRIIPYVDWVPDCEGYDNCEFTDVDLSIQKPDQGKSLAVRNNVVNGVWVARYNEDDYEVYKDYFLISADSELRTEDGDISLIEKGMFNLNSERGFGESVTITGGTGIYEGVTGWLAGSFALFSPELLGLLQGKICWPDE